MRGTSLFTVTLRTRKEFLPYQGLSWPGDRTLGALRAERQLLTSANGTSCSARHELCSRAFLFIVSAECALPTNASLFAIFARILANAPPPHESLRTCFVSVGFVLVRVRVRVLCCGAVGACVLSALVRGRLEVPVNECTVQRLWFESVFPSPPRRGTGFSN